ncbi:hypothetical protein CFC21_052268 [Triticum aestivum]|uniref:Hexosyltransferase n=3 Tax=Triticum TaxID=4564 RepID=A0A9R0VXP7_TRITD|nr:hypothetical protein CFC21_052268 [Triticum aestivum]VAH91398.1 unnamed protein product [Triticum turgidum subsp. durum]
MRGSEMRRRAPEYRRQSRRRLPGWIWWLVGIFLVVGLMLFVLHHNQKEQFRPPVINKGSETEEVSPGKVNFTEELLSSTSFARQLADQMTLAKAYVILAKEHGNLQLAWELSSQIRNSQRLLSQGAVSGRAITQEEAHPIITRLARLIYKAQDSHYDISTTMVTLKSHALALEERAKAAVVQTAEFGQLAAESLPKNIHCLTVKLTEEWLQNPKLRSRSEEHRNSTRLVDNNLYHFCIFSDNVLATSVVVNSTVSNANHPQQLVFHVVTDRINFGAMSTWFLINDFKGCTVEVHCIDEFSWLNAASSLVRWLSEMETKGSSGGLKAQEQEIKFHNPKFVSLLNHLRFYIPQILPNLEKVVFLDDDVVVQKDLTQLFSIELHGNVIGAVETCLESFHRYHKYLNFSQPIISSKIDPHTCGWAFGMNIDDRLIESAAVVHYNGNMKPWLKLAIHRYKSIWERHVNFSHPHVSECMFH